MIGVIHIVSSFPIQEIFVWIYTTLLWFLNLITIEFEGKNVTGIRLLISETLKHLEYM